MRIKNINVSVINNLQYIIMKVVDDWGSKEELPISRQTIIARGKKKGIKTKTIIYTINALLQKGYLRRACVRGRESRYVQLKRV